MKKRKIINYSSLAAVFVMMCVLRLWFTMIIIFSFGFIFTLAARRRSFCSNHCPMGTIQDIAYRKHELRSRSLHRILHAPLSQFMVFAVFWGAVAASVYLLFDTPDRLWAAMFSIMLGSAATAVMLQTLTRKRAWCSTVCPYGKILDVTVKTRSRSPSGKPVQDVR